MRRKAAAKRISQRRAAPINSQFRENAALKLVKPPETPVQPQTGRGLGKAGAKRLGRLLKRAIRGPEEATRKKRVALPKTPVRLLKHQIQTEAEAQTSSSSLHVSQLILNVVSQCKHQGGISMAELRQTLAAGGYDVSKNGRRLNVETKRLVNNETLVRTTRNTTFRLNKTLTDATRIRMIPAKPQAAKEKPKQPPAVRRSPRGAAKTKTKEKAAATSRKPAAKSQRKPAKPAGKKRRPTTNTTRRVQRVAKKTRRTGTRKQARRRRRQPARRRDADRRARR